MYLYYDNSTSLDKDNSLVLGSMHKAVEIPEFLKMAVRVKLYTISYPNSVAWEKKVFCVCFLRLIANCFTIFPTSLSL